MTIDRVPAGRVARSARTAAIAAPSTGPCPRSSHPSAARVTSGSRYGIAYTQAPPSSTGRPIWVGSVRTCTPARARSPEPNPSRVAESWLPEMTTTGHSSLSRPSASSARRTASTGGSARS